MLIIRLLIPPAISMRNLLDMKDQMVSLHRPPIDVMKLKICSIFNLHFTLIKINLSILSIVSSKKITYRSNSSAFRIPMFLKLKLPVSRNSPSNQLRLFLLKHILPA
jgi:hypothetical protein